MKITLGNRQVEVRYDNKAIFKLEKSLNAPLFAVMGDDKEMMKIENICKIIWAGVVEDITFDDFTDQLKLDTLGDIMPKVLPLLTNVFDTGNKKKAKKVRT